MSKLERWLPFRFRRNKGKSQGQEAASSRGPATTYPQSNSAALMPFGQPAVQQWMQDMFNDPFLREPFGRLTHLNQWFGDFSPTKFSPSVEVADEGKALKITAELPGMNKDDVKLQLDGGMLVISGEKKDEHEDKSEGVFRTERYYGYFQRAVPLPDDIDESKARAEFKDGVLTVRIPKSEAGPSESIEIDIA